jgi:hypothetical protein
MFRFVKTDCFWSSKGHSGSFKGCLRLILAIQGQESANSHFGPFLVRKGSFQTVSDHYEQVKHKENAVWDGFRPFQAISAYLESRKGSFGPIRSRCKPFKTVLGCFRLIWTALGRFRLFRAV